MNKKAIDGAVFDQQVQKISNDYLLPAIQEMPNDMKGNPIAIIHALFCAAHSICLNVTQGSERAALQLYRDRSDFILKYLTANSQEGQG